MKNNSSIPQVTVIAGPTAVGKGTIVQEAIKLVPDIWLSISVTTREPRLGEVNGVHYYFISDEEFDQILANDGVLEWALVHGRHRYGTPREPLEQAIRDGKKVLLELDLQGARQVKTKLPNALYVFVKPPSWETLEERLRGRGTEDLEEQQRRLQTAKQELMAENEFDITLVNEDNSVLRTTHKLLELMGISGYNERGN